MPEPADKQLIEDLFPLIYPALRRRAEQCMKGEAPGHTLQATALVHEVYLKLATNTRVYQNEQHLYAVVARVMRQVLVDHARARATGKRGGGLAKVALENACHMADQHSAMFLDVENAVDRLFEQDPLRAQMFELDFLCGLTNREIADALNVDESRVKYGLSVARAWLRQTLASKVLAPNGPEQTRDSLPKTIDR